ncbi:hypothetical protein [Pelagibaculum spongiae]|uniref:Uncharacterized protein n=1 Tax=Pelagibaculum spongiae TaxID=2080658 RepID=A0A2V1GY71_9GAMM|nr:hypothetical protein [Pelagibaculum spongiae]PVZ71726.1 hypothetical protein DC094_01485 [Pelagibaculum spongiae]
MPIEMTDYKKYAETFGCTYRSVYKTDILRQQSLLTYQNTLSKDDLVQFYGRSGKGYRLGFCALYINCAGNVEAYNNALEKNPSLMSVISNQHAYESASQSEYENKKDHYQAEADSFHKLWIARQSSEIITIGTSNTFIVLLQICAKYLAKTGLVVLTLYYEKDTAISIILNHSKENDLSRLAMFDPCSGQYETPLNKESGALVLQLIQLTNNILTGYRSYGSVLAIIASPAINYPSNKIT